MNGTALSLGGLGISLAILLANLRTWWRSSGRDIKMLGPFAGGFTLGSLSTLCAGGVLGVVAGWVTSTTNKAGTHAVPGATGQPDGTVTAATAGTLTAGGGLATFLIMVLTALAWKSAGKEMKKRMVGGIICGATLAVTAGFAGIVAQTILPAANGLGDGILAAINRGSL